MAEAAKIPSRMYIAYIVEANRHGDERASIWYGGDPKNLGKMIMDCMKDWYDPENKKLDKSLHKYYKMLQKEDLSFEEIGRAKVNANGFHVSAQITNDLIDIYTFVMGEVVDIFAKNGEKIDDFEDFEKFVDHFSKEYDLPEEFVAALKEPDESTLSRALLTIDYKYNYTFRHSKIADREEK